MSHLRLMPRARLRSIAALGAIALISALAAAPAAASKWVLSGPLPPPPDAVSGPIVANPGPVTFTGTGGYMAFLDGNPVSFEPGCSNGLDDDNDGHTDWPADPQCASAYDHDEEVAGDQAVSFAGDIDSQGNLLIPQGGIEIPEVEFGFDGPFGFLTITVKTTATGDATGHLNPSTGLLELSLPLKVKLKNLLWALKPCTTRFTLNVTTGDSGGIKGAAYSAADGTARVVENEFVVPEFDDCGVMTDIFNEDLPSDPGEASFSNDLFSDPILKPPPGRTVIARPRR